MLALVTALFVAAPGPSAVVRAQGFEVFLAAPRGWTVDARPKRSEGSLPAVLVRPGESFATAKSVMFLNLDRQKDPDLAAFVATRRGEFLKGRARASVRVAGTLVAGDGTNAVLLDLDDPTIPQYERRAYLVAHDGVATLFLQCSGPEARRVDAAALKALVASFRDLHAPHPPSTPPGARPEWGDQPRDAGPARRSRSPRT